MYIPREPHDMSPSQCSPLQNPKSATVNSLQMSYKMWLVPHKALLDCLLKSATHRWELTKPYPHLQLIQWFWRFGTYREGMETVEVYRFATRSPQWWICLAVLSKNLLPVPGKQFLDNPSELGNFIHCDRH